jgi:(S)-ureidoglycine aminohydrolase
MMQPQQLGASRTSLKHDHLLHTPDAFIRAPLPGMRKATAIIHTGPAIGAGFTEYTAEMEAGGSLGPALAQRFFYVLSGHVETATDMAGTGSYSYIPEGEAQQVIATEASRLVVIEKPYQDVSSVLPKRFSGNAAEVKQQPLLGDEGVLVQTLVPDAPEFDFAVNLMTFAPGASLAMVEMHIMEHGLMMLEGGGIYRLGDFWYPTMAGDFIWMAPYCPQWFGAIGKTPAKYLIYKDWNRHPL